MGILTRFIFCEFLGVSFSTATGDFTNYSGCECNGDNEMVRCLVSQQE